jgi:hypothetical protein
MTAVRRAAVSGLLAAWLAPLPALAGGLPAEPPAAEATPSGPAEQPYALWPCGPLAPRAQA